MTTGGLVRKIHVPAVGYDVWGILSSNATTLFVVCPSAGDIVEINLASGAVVKTISQLGARSAVASGSDLWVLGNDGLYMVDESTGNVLKTVGAGSLRLQDTLGFMASIGGQLWISSFSINPYGATDGAVVALNEMTGKIVHRATSGLHGPISVVSSGADLWIANAYGSDVTELNQTTAKLVRLVPLAGSWATAYAKGRVWVTTENGDSVTLLNPRTGKRELLISSKADDFDWPYAVAMDGTHAWVPNWDNNTVTELNESNGSLVRTLHNTV
jgi:outer membrane protein assembly factor BamB